MLTNLYEKNQLKTAHEEALIQVWDEIRDNQIVLTEFYEQLYEKFEAYRIFDLQIDMDIDKDLKILVHKDSIEIFKKQVAPVFRTDSVIPYPNDMLRVRGYFEIEVGSPILGGKLRNSMWNAFVRQPDFLSLTDFNTISDLEQMHALQLELNKQTNEWKNSLFSDFTIGEKEREKFLIDWFQVVGNQHNLLGLYSINLSKIDKE